MDNGGRTTIAIIIGLIAFALVMAVAAKSNRRIPVGPQPTPSVSAGQEG